MRQIEIVILLSCKTNLLHQMHEIDGQRDISMQCKAVKRLLVIPSRLRCEEILPPFSDIWDVRSGEEGVIEVCTLFTIHVDHNKRKYKMHDIRKPPLLLLFAPFLVAFPLLLRCKSFQFQFPVHVATNCALDTLGCDVLPLSQRLLVLCALYLHLFGF